MVNESELQRLNEEVRKNGAVDRAHILAFLRLIPTNDGKVIVEQVRQWLSSLHDVRFPQADIDAVIADLDSYGRVQPETILEFKRRAPRELPVK